MNREIDIINWARDRNIIGGSSALRQMVKLEEEMVELLKAEVVGDAEGIIDGIGDCLVVLAILAEMHNLDIYTCAEHAWNEIKDRKGTLVNGIFVKEK